jgi:hypothetical protein
MSDETARKVQVMLRWFQEHLEGQGLAAPIEHLEREFADWALLKVLWGCDDRPARYHGPGIMALLGLEGLAG